MLSSGLCEYLHSYVHMHIETHMHNLKIKANVHNRGIFNIMNESGRHDEWGKSDIEMHGECSWLYTKIFKSSTNGTQAYRGYNQGLGKGAGDNV